MTSQEEAVTVIQAEELRALIAKATDDDLSDGGRYFSGSCDDLTRCRHEEIGEYQHASDGELIEWLWNRRHAILDRFTRTSSSDAATPEVARPFSEWHEDHRDVLWWKLPIVEPPYCGSPLDMGRTMKVVVNIGVEEHDFPFTNTGGWPFSEDDERDLWWTPLSLPAFPAAPTGEAS